MKPRRRVVSNRERWLVSYADYMTLMFAFFVVLYSISLVKEEEYSVLSDTLGKVFKATEGTGISGDGILIENDPRENTFYGEKLLPESGAKLIDKNVQLDPEHEIDIGAPLEVFEAELSTLLRQKIQSNLVTIKQNGRWLEVKLDGSLLFSSGSASLLNRSNSVLSAISMLLSANNYKFRVRGYTDNQAINNELFESNWYLSAARATAVVEQFQRLGIAPQRMVVEAYGEFSPAGDNSTLVGRRQNRNVVIAVSADKFVPTINKDKRESNISKTKINNNDTRDSETINVIPLPHGGIRITTRPSATKESDATSENTDSDNK